MRPGPGLVVMALAFISGARRGSTSSISSKTTTTSSSPPLPTSTTLTFTAPPAAAAAAKTFPTKLTSSSSSSSYLITTSSAAPLDIYEHFGYFGSDFDHPKHNKRPKEPVPFNFFNTFFTSNFHSKSPSFSSSSLSSSSGNSNFPSFKSNPSKSNNFAYTYPLPSHLTKHYEDPRVHSVSNTVLHSAKQTRRATKKFRRRRKRRIRSANVSYKGNENANENLSDSETDTLTSTAVDSSSESAFNEQTTLARGLPVHFPSLTAAVDSSRSFDEDDIFALVAEEDLLSEESFDHLVKLTNDKIGDTNEEDYSSGTETVVESSSDIGSGTSSDNVHYTQEQEQQQHKTALEEFVHKNEQQQNEDPQLRDDNNNDDDDVDVDKPKENHESEQDASYLAHLVSNDNDKVVAVAKEDSTQALDLDLGQEQIQKLTNQAELESRHRRSSVLESHFPLTRLNPWISACDLAQPGSFAAPDLQGECSAGTLPVAWVDEGPGPPMCLKSCKEETPFTNKLNKENMLNNNSNKNNNNNSKTNNKNKNKNDNKLNKLVGYTTTTNNFNIKLRNSQPTISLSMNLDNNHKNNNKNINNNNNKDNNNKNNNNNSQNNMKQKLLHPFNYYQIQNNYNNKMAKSRRNSQENSAAAFTNLTRKTDDNDYDLMQSMMMMQQDDAVVVQHKQNHNEEQQVNDAAIAAAIVMQLNQQQNQANNNIVKMKLTTTASNSDGNQNNNNNNNNQYELKYNHMKQDHNSNNNKRYQSNSNNVDSQYHQQHHAVSSANLNNNRVDSSMSPPSYLKTPLPTTTPPPTQQKCLEYLGDSDTTMPEHLCQLLTPTERLSQLRLLRLRNCCERNVYSALHTLALNATLTGGPQCQSILEDIMDLDAMASRITCGLTEILFRFDCRQVYSIINQCDDCKEAYRRWVCSTLVPYFAEPNDVLKPPEIDSTTIKSSVGGSAKPPYRSPTSFRKNNIINNNTTMASNMTTSHNNTTTGTHNSSNNNNINETGMSIVSQNTATSNFITNNNKNNNNKNDIQYVSNSHQQQQLQQYNYNMQQQHHVKRRNIPKQQQHMKINNMHFNNNDIQNNAVPLHQQQPQMSQLHTPTTSPQYHTQALTFDDIISSLNMVSPESPNGLRSTSHHHINATNEATGQNYHYQSTNKRRKRSDNTTAIYFDVVNKLSLTPQQQQQQTGKNKQNQQQHQSLNFISTANSKDSLSVKDPVISKLLKRSKRKVEFRKRRRIRPCLSVCQTVEQKCPYLLPADRAPALPTQYAGEPTFLCLDYNIAETEEQLQKASHGPNDCCYTYCTNAADGICTYCNDFWDVTDIEKAAEVFNEVTETKVFNISMKAQAKHEGKPTIRVETKIQQHLGEEKNGLKMSTVAISIRNDTLMANVTRLAERLPYYAYCDGVYYYDDDVDDMPQYPNSENCIALPTVQSRCSIPYYATNYISSADMLGSLRKHNEAQKLLIWLSTLLCLWSCYSARSMRIRKYDDKRHDQQNTTAYLASQCQSCQNREIMQNKGNFEKVIKLWYAGKDCKIIILYKETKTTTTPTTTKTIQKISLKQKFKILRNFIQLARRSRTKLKLKIKFIQISSLILLIHYKQILLLLFKKRQKQKRTTKMKGIILCKENRIRKTFGKRFKITRKRRRNLNVNLKMKTKKKFSQFSLKNYCSCSKEIFSCSCNNTNIKNLTNFKYNFSNCMFNENNKNNNNNHIMILRIISKQISIIINTTTTITKNKTHKTIYYNSNNNKYRLVLKSHYIMIIINNNNTNQIFNSFSSISNTSHHYNYNYNYNNNNNYNYYYYYSYLNPNSKLIINNIMKLLMLLRMLLTLLNDLLKMPPTQLINNKNNNNNNIKHHMNMKNIQFNLSFSKNNSYNSKRNNYRYFYYYNFNINDWWHRRWWWWSIWSWWYKFKYDQSHLKNKHHYFATSLLFNEIRQRKKFQTNIIL